ncbi:hypothetical protein PHYPSEUDO_004133 [Phytophthora pseudosyringae]|uniref:Uncharacterized protein n=1 Tax=Phytophthora pseudosyringae TaxID=221518 RepID=A0A8T1WEL2_9STRA|nr:hypothetical protein PHYPSEUDO_004133 [Phytophthora pseudosyringae]
MLFSVDFFSRPFDHFLSSDAPATRSPTRNPTLAVLFPPVATTASDAYTFVGSSLHGDVICDIVPDTEDPLTPGSDPSTSDVGLPVTEAFEPPTSSPDVGLGAQSDASPDPSASDAGLDAVTVPGTLTASPRVGSGAQSVLSSDYGPVDSHRPGFRSRLYASFDGGFRPSSGRCAFAWCV